jgi:HlyD family secretion protein
MTATVSVTTARRDDVLRVPARALRFKPEDAEAGAAAGVPPNSPLGSAVYVLDPNGALQRVEIQVGLRDDRFAEVVAGDVELEQAVVVGLGPPAEKSASAPAASPFMPKRVR